MTKQAFDCRYHLAELGSAAEAYQIFSGGRADPGTFTVGDHLNHRGRVITSLDEALGVIAWLHGTRISTPALLSAALPPRQQSDTAVFIQDAHDIQDLRGVAVLRAGKMHFGTVFSSETSACRLFQAVTLDNERLSESEASPGAAEPEVFVYWQHPLTGFEIEFGPDEVRIPGKIYGPSSVRVNGALYGPGCLGSGGHDLAGTLGRLSRSALNEQIEAGGWTRTESPIGALYTRADLTLWKGQPLDLDKMQGVLASVAKT